MAGMDIRNGQHKNLPTTEDGEYDRAKDVKAFDDTKTGVQGLVEAGLVKLPPFFFMSPEDIHDHPTLSDPHLHCNFQVPIIDLNGVLDPCSHEEIVEKMRLASENWGFFRVINHGIPLDVLNGVIDGVRRFHEQPKEVKMKYYSRETEIVRYYSNYDLNHSKGASWRDTLMCVMAPDPPSPEKYPFACSGDEESRDHLFGSCPFSCDLWGTIISDCGFSLPSFSWPELSAWMVSHTSRKSDISFVLRMAWNAGIYYLWQERNNRLHAKIPRNVSSIFGLVKGIIRDKFAGGHVCVQISHDLAVKWGF